MRVYNEYLLSPSMAQRASGRGGDMGSCSGRVIKAVRGKYAENPVEQRARSAHPVYGAGPCRAGRRPIPSARPHAHATADAHRNAHGIPHAYGDLHAHADTRGNAYRNAHSTCHSHIDADAIGAHAFTPAPRTAHSDSDGLFHAHGDAGRWGRPASFCWRSRSGWREPSAGRDRASAGHRMGPAGACGSGRPGLPGLSDRLQATPALNRRSVEAPGVSSGKPAGGASPGCFP